MSDKCSIYRLDDFRKEPVNDVPILSEEDLKLAAEKEHELAEDLLKTEETIIKLKIDLLRVHIIDLATDNPLAAERLVMYFNQTNKILQHGSKIDD